MTTGDRQRATGCRPAVVRPAVLAIGITVVLSGCGAVASNGGTAARPSPAPPTLHLTLPPRPAGWPAPTGPGRTDRPSLRLPTNLPTGPRQARVYRLPSGPATAADVRRLAVALGMTAPPRRVGGGWQVDTPGGGRLVVTDRPGRPWTYHAAQPGRGPGSPAVIEPAAALRLLAALAGRLGLAGARLQIVGNIGTADPDVAGPTTGYATTAVFAGDQLLTAAGHLGTPVAGPSYPLVPATVALGGLRGGPAPAVPIGPAAGAGPVPGSPGAGGLDRVRPGCPLAADAGCGRAAQLAVTAVALGRVLAVTDGGTPLLVPAWLVTVAGLDTPLPRQAVDPRYLDVHQPGAGRSAWPTAVPQFGQPSPSGSPASPSDRGRPRPMLTPPTG